MHHSICILIYIHISSLTKQHQPPRLICINIMNYFETKKTNFQRASLKLKVIFKSASNAFYTDLQSDGMSLKKQKGYKFRFIYSQTNLESHV